MGNFRSFSGIVCSERAAFVTADVRTPSSRTLGGRRSLTSESNAMPRHDLTLNANNLLLTTIKHNNREGASNREKKRRHPSP